jgi:hypothetical protein
MNLQESSQLLSESLLDPDVFVRAAELIDVDDEFACVLLSYLDRTRISRAFFSQLYEIGDGYRSYSLMSKLVDTGYWNGSVNQQSLRVYMLLFASHAARDHNRSVRARLAAQKRKLTKV